MAETVGRGREARGRRDRSGCRDNSAESNSRPRKSCESNNSATNTRSGRVGQLRGAWGRREPELGQPNPGRWHPVASPTSRCYAGYAQHHSGDRAAYGQKDAKNALRGSALSAPSADLERFCQALVREHEHLLEASRSSRFRPPTDLATAQLCLQGDDGNPGLAIVAEILDLSGDGMKIAITPHHDVRVGRICLLRFQPKSGDGYQLRGEVRWLEASDFILVFGIRLLAAESPYPLA